MRILCAVGFLLAGSITASFAAGSTATPQATVITKDKATSTAKTTTKPIIKSGTTSKITSPPTGASGQQDAGRFGNITTAQRKCLAGQGVTLPTRAAGGVRPSGAPNPGATPQTAAAPRAFGGGYGNTLDSPKTTAVFKKCGIVLPTFGGGSGFNPKDPKYLALQKCMKVAGFNATGRFGQYDQADPDTAVALIKCQKSSGFTLPKRGERETGR